MKSTILAAAIASAMAATLAASVAGADEVEDLRKRIEKLEENNAATIDKLAQTQATAKKSEWASKITWKGDFRARHENVDPEEAVADQTRERIRARFGMTAKVNDTVKVTIQLATNAGNNDPRSANQTLGSGFERKGVALDLAYAEWQPVASFNVQLGKMPQPWQKVAGYFWDNDITPEGLAVKFTQGNFFVNGFSMVLSERSTQSDATLNGAQFGFKGESGSTKWTAALGYYDVGAVKDKITTTAGACTTVPAFFGGPQGNTTYTGGGCTRLLNDYNLVEALAQVDFKVGSLPMSVFGTYIQNQEADDLDAGYAAGVTLGKASDPKTWEVGLMYQVTEKDSQFGQFVDSDFAGNLTDSKGTVVKLGYAPAKNWTVSGTYFMNERFMDVGTPFDYDRYQIDLNFKF